MRKRKGKGGPGTAGGRNKSSERPQFGIRYGMRSSTAAERGGAIVVAEKNLGFLKVKKEQGNDNISTEGSASQRLSMDLATLEGEGRDSTGDVIREEDESDNLRVSDFQRGDDSGNESVGGSDEYDDYVEQPGSKRKQSTKETKRQGKRNRSKADEQDVSSSQVDQKPTLQIKYASLKLHPQTLYIVVRTLGTTTSAASVRSSASNPITETVSTANIGIAEHQQEEEDSLFPPGLDYFMS